MIRKIAELILLLALLILRTFSFAHEITHQEFIAWWGGYRNTPTIPSDLKEMEDYFISSGLVNRCSKFWIFANKMNIEQIAQYGHQNFKQTVACNYFTWLVESQHEYSRNLWMGDLDFLQIVPSTELSKKHTFFTHEQSYQYNCTTALLYNYLLKNNSAPYLDALDEPFFGNPPSITINGKLISQDVLNSLLEYLSMARHYDISNISTVLEVGGGSGRTAYCFLKLMDNIKYIIIDIPPALFLSQTYLSEVFPDRKVFKFRTFDNFEDVKSEFLSSDIIFMTPDQMLKLPGKSVDLFVAIDCLHEMTSEEVQLYFNEADRLASLCYFKCWNETVVPFDNVSHTINSYPVPVSWEEIFKDNCYVPSTFFHAFYEIR